MINVSVVTNTDTEAKEELVDEEELDIKSSTSIREVRFRDN